LARLLKLLPRKTPLGPETTKFRLFTSAGVPAGRRSGASVHARLTSNGVPLSTRNVYERVAGAAETGNASGSPLHVSWNQLLTGSPSK
jgi:hypothetical protein